jgi:hypothetical protein
MDQRVSQIDKDFASQISPSLAKRQVLPPPASRFWVQTILEEGPKFPTVVSISKRRIGFHHSLEDDTPNEHEGRADMTYLNEPILIGALYLAVIVRQQLRLQSEP